MNQKGKTYPHSTTIKVAKEKIKGKETPFMQIKRASFNKAAKELSNTATIVWLYYMSNLDGHVETFSPTKIHNDLGIALSAARKAHQELINKKYLVQSEFNPIDYTLYENPDTTQREKIIEKKRAEKQEQEVREPQTKKEQVREPQEYKPPMIRGKTYVEDKTLMPDGNYYTIDEWDKIHSSVNEHNDWIFKYWNAKAAMGYTY